MACLALIPSFLEASCCRVDVVKGAYGFLVEGFASTEVTARSAPSSFFARSEACEGLSTSTSWTSFPLSSKLFEPASFSFASFASFASN